MRVVVRGIRQLRRTGSVRVHHVDVGVPGPPAREGDSRAVRGPGGLDLEERGVLVGRVAVGLGQPPLPSTVGRHDEDRVVAVAAADESQIGARGIVASAACSCGQSGDCNGGREQAEGLR